MLAALETKSVSPTVLVGWILNKRNVKKDPTAITQYFKRHPELKKQIDDALNEMAPTVAQAVDNSLFENGNFREVPSVKEWILYMNTKRGRKGRDLHPKYIEQRIYHLKYICQKYLKHPDRLSYHDAQEIFLAEKEQGRDTNKIRGSIKAFLMSKGAPEWEKIGVGKPRGFGKYKDLYVEPSTQKNMIEYVHSQSFEAYVVDMIMLFRGLRVGAVLSAKIESDERIGNTAAFNSVNSTFTVLEKFRDVKTFKLASPIADLLKQVIGDRKEGLIFNVKDDAMERLNGKAIDLFCPELRLKYKNLHPNHFWRHICIQNLLKKTEYNSKRVASDVQCTEQSLNESYGAASEKDAERWADEDVVLLAE